MQNYRRVLLLPNCGKNFEHLITTKFIERHLIKSGMMVNYISSANKLSLRRISGNLQIVLQDFLRSRTQNFFLKGQYSSWKNVHADVPQDSILGHFLFLIYIDSPPQGLKSNPK